MCPCFQLAAEIEDSNDRVNLLSEENTKLKSAYHESQVLYAKVRTREDRSPTVGSSREDSTQCGNSGLEEGDKRQITQKRVISDLPVTCVGDNRHPKQTILVPPVSSPSSLLFLCFLNHYSSNCPSFLRISGHGNDSRAQHWRQGREAKQEVKMKEKNRWSSVNTAARAQLQQSPSSTRLLERLDCALGHLEQHCL